MKHLRICLLLLLAALLPIRGAMAAAMLCPPGGVGTQSEMRLMGQVAVGHAHAEDVGMSAHDHDAHNDGNSHDHGPSQNDKCKLCSAFCSLTPLLSEVAGVIEPGDLADAAFPRFSAPPPSSLADGQERPPRSI